MTVNPSNYVDFYEILSIQESASEEAIRDAIKNERRTWIKRQSSADPKRRSDAETRVRQIDDAEKVLLDATAREEFNKWRASRGSTTGAPPPGASDQGNWLERAQGYLDQGDAHSANYAAREATAQEGNNYQAWYTRARSSLLLSNTQDAVFEFNEAIRLEPNVAAVHFDLGSVYEAANGWNEALACYEKARSLEPEEPLYDVSVASVYLQSGRPEEALVIMERVVKDNPNVDVFNFYLAHALNDVTLTKLSLMRDGSRVITTEEQAKLAQQNIGRALALNAEDADLKEMLTKNKELADKAAGHVWRLPFKNVLGGIVAVGAEMGCGGFIAGVFIAFLIFFIPVIVGFAIHPVIGVLITGGYGYFLYTQSYVPGWKYNAVEHKGDFAK